MKESKALTHGGARRRSGRKPVLDKKVTISVYPQKSRIDLLGLDEVKAIAIQAIEKEYEKRLEKS